MDIPLILEFIERHAIFFLGAGLAIVALAYLWLTIRAIKVSKWWLVGIIPPFSVVYLLTSFRKAIGPFLLLLLGGLVFATPFVSTHVIQPLIPRQPWENFVNGELHLTLTGLKDFQYPEMKRHAKATVVQMANGDVTDQTLENLADFFDLRELDLNDTQITDQGLIYLKRFPKLEIIRLAKTKITDDGFEQSIAARDLITDVDVRGTDVKSATLRRWKASKDGRKFLK